MRLVRLVIKHKELELDTLEALRPHKELQFLGRGGRGRRAGGAEHCPAAHEVHQLRVHERRVCRPILCIYTCIYL
jgi:hypothetical protein